MLDGRRFGDAIDMTQRIGYDNLDRVVSTQYSDGTTLEYERDDLGRTTSVKGLISDVQYTTRGQLGATTYANGAVSESDYDDLMRLASRMNKDATGKLLEGMIYSRDRVNNITQIADMGEVGLHGTEFTHDAWYRVTQAVQGPEGSSQTTAYGYDALDRTTSVTSDITEMNLGQMSYDDQRPLALEQAGALQMAFDAAGQMTQRGDLSFTWDFMSRITSATRGEALETHVYGIGKSRVAIIGEDRTVVYGPGDLVIRDGVSSVYARIQGERSARVEGTTLGAMVLADVDTDGRITAADAIGFTADSVINAKHILGAAAARMLADGQDAKTYLHTDHLGSIVSATDEGGTMIGQRSFGPTGVVRSKAGYVDAYGFTGQEHNDFTGLIQFQMRDLDPITTRWASFDPLFQTLSASQMSTLGEATTGYAYVAGNFSNSIDPLGLNGEGGPKRGGKAARPVKKAPGNRPGKAALPGNTKGGGGTLGGNAGENPGGEGQGGNAGLNRAGEGQQDNAGVNPRGEGQNGNARINPAGEGQRNNVANARPAAQGNGGQANPGAQPGGAGFDKRVAINNLNIAQKRRKLRLQKAGVVVGASVSFASVIGGTTAAALVLLAKVQGDAL